MLPKPGIGILPEAANGCSTEQTPSMVILKPRHNEILKYFSRDFASILLVLVILLVPAKALIVGQPSPEMATSLGAKGKA